MVELGQRALAGAPLDDLIGEAVESAARELGTDCASVLELTGDGRGLLVRGGHGLPDGVLGGVLYAGEEELPGYALHADGPVVIDDFATETRFGASALQRDLAIVSALAAPIGSRERLFGVLGANSRTPSTSARTTPTSSRRSRTSSARRPSGPATRSSCATARRAFASWPTPRRR